MRRALHAAFARKSKPDVRTSVNLELYRLSSHATDTFQSRSRGQMNRTALSSNARLINPCSIDVASPQQCEGRQFDRQSISYGQVRLPLVVAITRRQKRV